MQRSTESGVHLGRHLKYRRGKRWRIPARLLRMPSPLGRKAPPTKLKIIEFFTCYRNF